MTLNQVMAQLEKWGSDKLRELNKRQGAGDQQFGVNRSNIRKLAEQIKTNHELALELWRTGNIDAMLLATLLMAPKELSQSDIEKMIKSCTYFQLADWFVGNVVKATPFKDKLRTKWSASKDEYTGRAGWSLQTGHVKKGNPSGDELASLLDTIESKMKAAPYRMQEAMNFCLGEIGIRHADLRKRCIQIGEKLGVFKDYPTPKGCISPYVPEWIAAVVGKK
jgi:3-methyladenine DNA glycosylase AlkD